MNSMKAIMRRLPPDGRVRKLLRDFNMAPRVNRKAISVKELAENVGLPVVQCDLPNGMAGRLVSDAFSDSGYSIEVNKRHSVQARRFTVLHELGHFFLHTNSNDMFADPLYLDRSEAAFYVDSNQEREANQFAEALLFGDGALRGAAGLYGNSVPQLAHHFGVSEKVIEIAMKRF